MERVMKLEDNDIVSAFDAKTHLSQLLGQVQKGRHFTITKHNIPIATLAPILHHKQPVHEIIDLIFKARKCRLEGFSLQELQELKEEGRH